MRFMVMHKVDADMEAGVRPGPELIANMGAFIEGHAKAGVFLLGVGLKPSATRTRLTLSGGRRTVQDGPYAGSNELIAGCALVQVKSKDDAIAWASRYAEVVGDAEIEIGPVNEPWDLGLAAKPANPPLRYLLVHKGDRNSEAGVPLGRAQMAGMATLIEEMTAAGVLLATAGL